MISSVSKFKRFFVSKTNSNESWYLSTNHLKNLIDYEAKTRNLIFISHQRRNHQIIHKKTIKTWIFRNFKRENDVCLIVGVIVVSTWFSLYYSWLFVSDGSSRLEPLSPELPPHLLYIIHNLSRSDIFFCLAFSFLCQHITCFVSLLSFLLLQKRNSRWKQLWIRYMWCDFWTIYCLHCFVQLCVNS